MKFIIYFFISIFLLSCSNKEFNLIEINNAKYFTNNNFKETINKKHRIFNNDFIGAPVKLTMIDTFLIVIDMKKDSILHIFSTVSNKQLVNTISRGYGPNELIGCASTTYSNNSKNFWAFDISSMKFIEYNIDSLLNNNTKSNYIIDFNKIEPQFIGINQPQWISDSTFICNSLLKYNERFFIFNNKLNLKKEIHNKNINIHPKYTDNILGEIFSSLISIKPDKSKIAIAGRYLDLLEIYDIEGNLLDISKGPNKEFDFKFDINNSIQQNKMIKLPETKKAYIEIKTTNNCIYLLYSGKDRKNSNEYFYSKTIYTFDWDGNPLNKFILDSPILSFEINEKENKMYAINQNAYLITYDL